MGGSRNDLPQPPPEPAHRPNPSDPHPRRPGSLGRHGPALRIEGGLTGLDTRVFLDGHEVHGLRRLALVLDHESINEVEIVIEPGSVQVDAEAMAALTALVEGREDG